MRPPDLRRLTKPEYWDSKYARASVAQTDERPKGRSWVRLIKRLLGTRMLDYLGSYSEYLLWEVLYPSKLPAKKGARVLEVGSAPGDHLVQLSRSFGYEAYGVEYSEAGVRVNREIFRRE